MRVCSNFLTVSIHPGRRSERGRMREFLHRRCVHLLTDRQTDNMNDKSIRLERVKALRINLLKHDSIASLFSVHKGEHLFFLRKSTRWIDMVCSSVVRTSFFSIPRFLLITNNVGLNDFSCCRLALSYGLKYVVYVHIARTYVIEGNQ